MPVALHCVGARHPIVYVALVVRGRAVHVRVRRRAVEVRSGRVGTAYERPDTGLRKQRRKYATGPPSKRGREIPGFPSFKHAFKAYPPSGARRESQTLTQSALKCANVMSKCSFT